MDYPYKIPYSKTKMTLLVLLSIGFIAVSTWLTVVAYDKFGDNMAAMVMVFGVMGILFGALGMIVIGRMLNSGKLAIEVNDEGIRDETSGVAVGLIRWEDIERLEPYSVTGNDFISVFVRNPEEYYAKARGTLAGKAMRLNEKMTGTPIQLNCGSVKTPPEQLLELLRAELAFQRELNDGPGLSLAELIRQREALYL